MKVELIAYTPNPEQVVASAAKLCYSAVGIDEIQENLTEENTLKFLNILMDMGHGSPIEHVSFTFAVEGVSRVLTHQLVRHRLASYSQQSQRYVKLEQFEYVIPPEIEKIESAKKIFVEAMENDQKYYNELVDVLVSKYIETFIKEGKSEKSANRLATKKAIEDARFVFPNACETKIVFTMNARSLINFFEKRCCNRAQWEIREMAIEVLRKVKEVSPILFRKAGPSCMSGVCPEGKMTCGKINEVREKFEKL
jgi:thymidylate synthase (FAD)